MKLVVWSLSDTGKKRDHNEDSFLADSELELFAVADGMGGHRGGARASSLALEVLRTEIERAAADLDEAVVRLRGELQRRWISEPEGEEDTVPNRPDAIEETAEIPIAAVTDEAPAAQVVVQMAARKASAAVFREARNDPLLRGMGTTLTAMLHRAGRMHMVHAGDSRAYLLRDGSLRQLTEDHSWTQEQVRAGIITEEQAKESEFRHVITRSIGFERDVEVDTVGIVVQSGDCFLLCSDGMSNHFEHDELEELMRDEWYSRLPERLVEAANARGGDDNITVVVVYVANHNPA